jgi:signal transduction histidine kinase
MMAEPQPGDQYHASPLLTRLDPLVRIHFMVSPDGTITSPESPSEKMRKEAEYHEPPLPNETLILALKADFSGEDFQEAIHLAENEARLRAAFGNAYMQAQSPFDGTPSAGITESTTPPRGHTYDVDPNDPFFGSPKPIRNHPRLNPNTPPSTADLSKPPLVSGEVSSFYPIWLNRYRDLFLLRTVETTHGIYIQGIWVDWPKLKEGLEERIAADLPNASFRHTLALTDSPSSTSLRNSLVTLPITLTAGSPPIEKIAPPPTVPGLSRDRIILIACWVFAALAIVGIGSLLFGTVSLSERRATFVSAVTHELRTPLTTFQLYTEMLADDMVPPESRKGYIATLYAESARLTHLVENVLGFARLEKGRALRRDEILTIDEIVFRAEHRLASRLSAEGMKLETAVDPEVGVIELHTDGTAVEQILFNLTDNSAKYASGKGTVVKLSVRADDQLVHFEFSDNGPGVPASALKKLFKAFNRSAEEAAGNKPGVGLGLAFSRQLARRLGGDLKLIANSADGCAFDLSLPR